MSTEKLQAQYSCYVYTAFNKFLLNFQRYMYKLAEVQQGHPHASPPISTPSASSNPLTAKELEHAEQVEN